MPSSRAKYCSAACRQYAFRERNRIEADPSKRHGWRNTTNDQASRIRDTELVLELVHELGEHARRGGTAYGAAVIVKRVAKDWGINVSMVGLPRPTRAEREDADWARRDD